jgi:ubiquitin-conjugating enzyme E2 Z
MNIEGVLITIRSLLDNQPYLHEPRQKDSPMFNDYVRCHTWRWLLLDYFDREQDADAKEFLLQYVRQHGAEMVAELERQKLVYGGARSFTSSYKPSVLRRPDYDALLSSLKSYVLHSLRLHHLR